MLKVCGIMCMEDINRCMECQVDIIGFVVEYPVPVPWNLSREEAGEIIHAVKSPCQSCIVTGGEPAKIISLVKELKPSFVQLHYKETLADTREILDKLEPYGTNVIKTIPIEEEERFYQFGTADLAECTKMLSELDIAAILVDARQPSNAAGESKLIDMDFYKCVKKASAKPVMLAGGITPDNIGDIICQTGAAYFDIMSGVEQYPGKKDRQKLVELCKKIT